MADMWQWEYRVLRIPDYSDAAKQQDLFAPFGAEFWELVSVHDGFAYFKRIKPQILSETDLTWILNEGILP